MTGGEVTGGEVTGGEVTGGDDIPGVLDLFSQKSPKDFLASPLLSKSSNRRDVAEIPRASAMARLFSTAWPVA